MNGTTLWGCRTRPESKKRGKKRMRGQGKGKKLRRRIAKKESDGLHHYTKAESAHALLQKRKSTQRVYVRLSRSHFQEQRVRSPQPETGSDARDANNGNAALALTKLQRDQRHP